MLCNHHIKSDNKTFPALVRPSVHLFISDLCQRFYCKNGNNCRRIRDHSLRCFDMHALHCVTRRNQKCTFIWFQALFVSHLHICLKQRFNDMTPFPIILWMRFVPGLWVTGVLQPLDRNCLNRRNWASLLHTMKDEDHHTCFLVL